MVQSIFCPEERVFPCSCCCDAGDWQCLALALPVRVYLYATRSDPKGACSCATTPCNKCSRSNWLGREKHHCKRQPATLRPSVCRKHVEGTVTGAMLRISRSVRLLSGSVRHAYKRVTQPITQHAARDGVPVTVLLIHRHPAARPARPQAGTSSDASSCARSASSCSRTAAAGAADALTEARRPSLRRASTLAGSSLNRPPDDGPAAPTLRPRLHGGEAAVPGQRSLYTNEGGKRHQ